MIQKANRNIMIVAGEASGDQRAAEVVNALKKNNPHLQFVGIGGNEMRAAGVETLIDIHELAVMGFIEVIRHLPHLFNVMQRTKKMLQTYQPALLILVDYPGFNLRLAKTAKQLGIKVLFYISPQVWAWRQGRVKKIAKIVDHMAVIFPFEKKFYEKHAVPVTYVGHPLTEKIKTTLTQTAAREKLKLSEYNPLITLCPGSRYSELESLLPTMLLAARKVAQQFPNALFLIAQASTITKERILQLLEDNLTTKNSTAQVHFKIVSDDSLNAMSASDLIVTASGTATLEAALLNKPMIVVYKVSLVTGFIIKRMLKIQHISLCNIVAGEKVVPELIQENFTESQLVEEMLKILTDTGLAQNTITKLKIINQQLGDLQAADSVAAIAERMLQ